NETAVKREKYCEGQYWPVNHLMGLFGLLDLQLAGDTTEGVERTSLRNSTLTSDWLAGTLPLVITLQTSCELANHSCMQTGEDCWPSNC
ncbi:hypothetical protein PFISCL1PPCAC_22156, partial [Pristionchus fissidentatus]